jgi:hypothetical protein
VDYCTTTCTFVDGCTSTSTTFSSLAFICVVYASTTCCSIALSSFNFSMNTGSLDVHPSPPYSLTRQCFLLLCKNSITNVLIISMS